MDQGLLAGSMACSTPLACITRKPKFCSWYRFLLNSSTCEIAERRLRFPLCLRSLADTDSCVLIEVQSWDARETAGVQVQKFHYACLPD